jgi:hypothetical protein
MAGHVTALRPWLVPRRMPFVGVDGTLLRLPLAPAVPLTPAEAAVMRASDGTRDASEVAAAVLADPSARLGDVAEVFALMGRLADSHRLAWQVDVAPQDIRPERSMRTLLSRVTDDGVRGQAETALDELTAARDELAGAAGDAERVATAMAGLETTFTRLAGVPPTRRAGELYAGRTLAYEECLRGDTVRLGADALDGTRAALALVLDSARWFTATCGGLYARYFDEAYRQRAVRRHLADRQRRAVRPAAGGHRACGASAASALVGDPGPAARRPADPAPGSRPAGAGDIGVSGPAAALADGGAPQPRPDDRGRGSRRRRPAHLGARRGPPQHRHHALRHVAGVQ